MAKGIFDFQVLPNISPNSKWEDHEVQMWINLANRTVRYIFCENASLTPMSVSPNSTSDQLFVVPGLTTTMNVFVNPPTLSSGLGIAYCQVSAVDTLKIRFFNVTGGALTPASGVYNISAIRR